MFGYKLLCDRHKAYTPVFRKALRGIRNVVNVYENSGEVVECLMFDEGWIFGNPVFRVPTKLSKVCIFVSAYPPDSVYFIGSAEGPCTFSPSLTAINLSHTLLIRLTTADNNCCCVLHRHPEQNVSAYFRYFSQK